LVNKLKKLMGSEPEQITVYYRDYRALFDCASIKALLASERYRLLDVSSKTIAALRAEFTNESLGFTAAPGRSKYVEKVKQCNSFCLYVFQKRSNGWIVSRTDLNQCFSS
jgi:hypothetical protein